MRCGGDDDVGVDDGNSSRDNERDGDDEHYDDNGNGGGDIGECVNGGCSDGESRFGRYNGDGRVVGYSDDGYDDADVDYEDDDDDRR